MVGVEEARVEAFVDERHVVMVEGIQVRVDEKQVEWVRVEEARTEEARVQTFVD